MTYPIPFPIHPGMSLETVTRVISNLPFGRTDCAQPMLDAFTVYTDIETWAGKIHPVQALRDYCQKTGIPARLVVGMTSNGFTIANLNDAGMLDVVGFTTSTPSAIADFVADRLRAGAVEVEAEE